MDYSHLKIDETGKRGPLYLGKRDAEELDLLKEDKRRPLFLGQYYLSESIYHYHYLLSFERTLCQPRNRAVIGVSEMGSPIDCLRIFLKSFWELKPMVQ